MKRQSILCLLILSCVIFCGCGSDSYKEYSFKDLIDSETTYNVPDSSFGISMLWDIKTYKDSFAVFTDMFNHTLFKYNFKNNELVKLGRPGRGPGEYVDAYGLLIKDGLIYYSDSDERGIECVDFNGKNPKRIDNVYLNSYAPQYFMIDRDSTFLFLDENARAGYFVHSSQGKKYGKTLKIFAENHVVSYPFAGAYLKENKLYFMYLVESKIYSVNLDNGEEEYHKIKINGFFNWDDVKNNKFTKKMDENFRKNYSRVGKFNGSQFNGKTFFFVSIVDAKNKCKTIICNEEGDVLFAVKDLDEYGFVTISEDLSYIYTLNEKNFTIKSFKWNKKFGELLNTSK